MKTRMLAVLAVPLLAGCGVAFGAHGGVHTGPHGHDDVYYEDAAYDRVPYDHEYGRRVSYRRLPIPRGHLPPPGRCRVWLPGVPPGHQPAPGPCRALERRVPRGGWLVERPRAYPGVVELIAFDPYRPRVRVRYAYDTRTGRRIPYR